MGPVAVDSIMKRAIISAIIAISILPLTAAVSADAHSAAGPLITVYKDPNCGCCKAWIAYLEKRGFRVDAHDTDNLADIKTKLGVPLKLAGCHTALIGGYIIEGHVPAEDITRLLAKKPKIAGLAVPGMPAGSPGMEGMSPRHYQVIAFTKNGRTSVFAAH